MRPHEISPLPQVYWNCHCSGLVCETISRRECFKVDFLVFWNLRYSLFCEVRWVQMEELGYRCVYCGRVFNDPLVSALCLVFFSVIIFICCKEKFPKDFLFQLACMIPENAMQAAKARKQFSSPVQLWQWAAQKGAVSSGYVLVATNCCPSGLLVHATSGKWCLLLHTSSASQQEWGVRSPYQTFRIPYCILNLIFIAQNV